jgi:hypothetical protein
MKRVLIGALLTALALTSSIAPAYAAPKKKGKAAAEAPQSAEIAKTMGDLKWGMPREEVSGYFAGKLKEKYKPLLAKASGALEEDKLRARQKEELAKLKTTDFNGKKTGLDVSFLKGEFTHHNGETLLVVSDDNSENYYFFIQNKLWKWYKAFKADAFEGKSFDQFADAIQGRYGKGKKVEGEATHGGGKQSWVEWQDQATRLRAVDNSHFYGFYCMVFEDKATLRKLPELRTTKVSETKKGNSLIDSVTSDEANNAAADSNPDVMDRITGKNRNRQDAPDTAKKGEAGKKGETAPSAPPPDSTGGVKVEDDPLKGLGL